MKPRHDWHRTPFGRLALFLGGLRLAVPVMFFVAIAMGVGTYLDSTEGIKVASRYVYGSAWFIALMALVCVSLVFAVITRYPWKRRHTGFMIVHAGLIVLIVGGFWSLFGRIEGRVMLMEGSASSEMEVDTHRVELLSGGPQSSNVLAHASAEEHVSGKLRLKEVAVEIVDRWENTTEERYIADDGPAPLRAVELTLGPPNAGGQWIAEAAKSGGPAFLAGMTVRVLGAGETFEAPEPAPETNPGYVFTVNGEQYPLAEEGAEAFPGWTVSSLRRFQSALVDAGGLRESDSGSPNPAVEVLITDGAGTTERHTAFEQFPDMILGRAIEGTASSGAQLSHKGSSQAETLVIHGTPPAIAVTYVGASGVQTFEHDGAFPWTFDVAGRRMTIVDQVSRARMASRFVQAPPAQDVRPALIVRVNDGEPQPLAWKASLPVPEAGPNAWLRYGPRRVQLPFSVHLDEFRKTDYPGTMMAMAYESDVTVTEPGGETKSLTVYMNNPYAYDVWKVYQSGFIEDHISIFSVMKDPGLLVTYIGCILLCVGIVVMFYVRALGGNRPSVVTPLPLKEAES